MLKAIIRAGLRRARPEPFLRTPIARKRQKLSTNYIIEFIGVSGAGKTYMLNALPASEKRKWWLREDLDITPSFDRNEKLCKFLMFEKIKRLSDELSFAQIERLISWYFRVLLIDNACNSVLPKGSLLDEGLFHNFGDVLEPILKDELHFHHKQVTSNRAFVYVYADVEFIFKRIRKRQKRKPRQNPYHWGLTDQELRRTIDNSISACDDLVQLLEMAGRPILRVDSNEMSSAQMSDAFHKFLNELQRN